jgi:hypothetical protein
MSSPDELGIQPALTSLESNTNGSGARFGPLQKGWPVLVTASLGKLNKSCLISLAYFSSNCKRAQAMHSSNVSGLLVTKKDRICSTCSFCWPEYLSVLSK